MKLIEDTIWWEFACTACGAKWQAEPKDVTSRANLDSDLDEVGRIPIVKCGKCGKEHDVPEGLLTEKIIKIAERKHRGSRSHNDD